MDEIDVSESFVQDDQKNQFLDDAFKYENCPHCQRNFFIGKLKFHLKLCKPNNPMTKSPLRKTKRSYIQTALEKNFNQVEQPEVLSPTSFKSPQKYKKCEYCRATFPLMMIEKHSDKCNLKPNQETNPQDSNKIKSRTKIDFEFKKDTKESSSALPRIRNSAKDSKNVGRKFVPQDLKDLKNEYTVRIRQELSCFKKALQVQQIECQFCHRKFSKEASLRHIPICEKIKMQQMHQEALKKHSKSQIYKLASPIKKTTLFRSKFMVNSSGKSEELQIKSARISEVQRVDRQKINNTTLMVPRQQRKQSKLSNLKTLIVRESEPTINQLRKSERLDMNRGMRLTQKDQMNMTFSKDLNGSSTGFGLKINAQNEYLCEKIKFASEKLDVLVEEQATNQLEKNHKLQKELTQDVENEFLQVTPSKKFFVQIPLEQSEAVFQMKINNETSHYQQNKKIDEKIKLRIDLTDLKKKKIINQHEEEYENDFQD